MNQKNAEDVAVATAAYFEDVWCEIVALPANERFLRMSEIFLTVILSYCECQRAWLIPPMPSDN